MINSLQVRNFKGFTDATLSFAPITVLTGLNSTGKSTVIQSILIIELAQRPGSVALNGPYGLALGDAHDVLNVRSTNSEIELSVERDGLRHAVTLRVPEDRAVSLDHEVDGSNDPWMPELHYLAAERLGPRDLLLEAPPGGIESVGIRGEYTAHVLAGKTRSLVPAALRHPDEDKHSSGLLGRQVEAWMEDLFGPILIEANWLAGSSAATIRFRGQDAATDWLRPANVGFGLTYALPIVVAGLTCPAGSLLLVENPEAHLHPAAQSALGKFLARLPSAGVQCVVETHSEHVINGLRIASASEAISLSPDDLLVYFFTSPDERVAIRAGRSGGLSAWPIGFFDQAERDLADLSRIRRPVEQ